MRLVTYWDPKESSVPSTATQRGIGSSSPVTLKDLKAERSKKGGHIQGTFLEREMISKEDSGSKIDLEEIQESADEEPIVNTDTQQKVVTPVEPDEYPYPSQKQVMDVKTAFINGKLTEDVFMAQPEGFENAKYPKRVCKLQKAIYELKQASRSLNLCFYEKVTRFEFSRSEDESCIYIKVSGSVVVFLVLYVDDILLIGNDIPTLQSVKEWLGKCFAMKDLGDAAYVLGIKIYRDRTRRLIGLSQDTYLDKILKRFKMENSKKGNLPLHHGIKISSDLCPKTDDELDKMSRVPYASAIGSIMYAMTCTRPDVSFALSMVSRHQQNPGEGHWTAVKNILKYLRNTKDRFLVYGGEKELRVTGYCDASWQTDKDDSKSQSGWVFLLNGGAVTWKSSKQDTVADSTCESEYIAACEASKEAIWMKNFIGDLGVVPTVQDPIEIFCDNESAVALTKEPKDHGKSKHIDRKYHFVRSKVAEGHVIVKDVRSEDNSADPFTKALAKSKHDEHAWSIGLKDKIKFTLRYENKEYVLDEQIPIIDNDSTQEEIEAHQKHYDDANKVSCIMAASMSPELQKTFENTWAYEMNQQLKEMFQAKASKERLDVVKSLMACKPKPEASICAFVLKMKGYFDRLESVDRNNA
ncbi:putative RNA-directed DNA polymerase [Tanacetum coccineum]